MKPISRHCAFASSTHTKCPTFAWSHTRGKAVQCYCTCHRVAKLGGAA